MEGDAAPGRFLWERRFNLSDVIPAYYGRKRKGSMSSVYFG
jgi:hypothetical protein